MVHDDDTRPHYHFEIDVEDRPPEPGRVRRPPLRIRKQILEWATRPGWGPERIYARMRRIEQVGVSLADVRYVIARGDPRQVDAPTQPG